MGKFEKINMKKENIILPINNHEYVEIALPETTRELMPFDVITITYHNSNGTEYPLYQDFVTSALDRLIPLIDNTIHGNSTLHASIKEDIGYLWNEYLHENSECHFVKTSTKEGHSFWVGTDFLVWESLRNTSTWLYEKNGAITFEITQNYPWHFEDPEKNETFVPYEEFIKNYQPLVITTIEKSVAQEWLAKARTLSEIIDRNYQIWLKNDVNQRAQERRPIDGQTALDQSELVQETMPRRIGVSSGQFVVLDRGLHNEFNGHVRTWQELSTRMRMALLSEGLIDNNGRILK